MSKVNDKWKTGKQFSSLRALTMVIGKSADKRCMKLQRLKWKKIS